MWLIHLLHILFADKSIIFSLAKWPLSFPLHILTIYHKTPTSQDSIAQRAEDEISASPRVDTRQDLVGRWKARPRGLTTLVPRGRAFIAVRDVWQGLILQQISKSVASNKLFPLTVAAAQSCIL